MSVLDLDDAQIRRIGAAARERTLTEHTSERRSQQLLEAFEIARSHRPASRTLEF
jgi:hypothetical protein